MGTTLVVAAIVIAAVVVRTAVAELREPGSGRRQWSFLTDSRALTAGGGAGLAGPAAAELEDLRLAAFHRAYEEEWHVGRGEAIAFAGRLQLVLLGGSRQTDHFKQGHSGIADENLAGKLEEAGATVVIADMRALKAAVTQLRGY